MVAPPPFTFPPNTGATSRLTMPNFIQELSSGHQQSNGTSSQASTIPFGATQPVVQSTGCQQCPCGIILGSSRGLCGEVSDTPKTFGPVSGTWNAFGQVSSAPVGFGQVSSAPVGFGQVSSAPVGFGQVSSAPIGFGQVSSAPVGFGSKPEFPEFGQVCGTTNAFGQVSSAPFAYGSKPGFGQVCGTTNTFGQVSSEPVAYGSKPEFGTTNTFGQVSGTSNLSPISFGTSMSNLSQAPSFGSPYTTFGQVSGTSNLSPISSGTSNLSPISFGTSTSNLSQAPSFGQSPIPSGASTSGQASSASFSFGQSPISSGTSKSSQASSASFSFCIKPDFGEVSSPLNPFSQVSATSNLSPMTSGTSAPPFQAPPFGSTSNSSNAALFGTSNPSQTSSFWHNKSIPCTNTWGSGKAVVDTQQVGSRVSPYVPTTESLDHSHPVTNSLPVTKMMSISAMNVYSDKSHEELRLEDYQQQQKNQGSVKAFVETQQVGSRVSPYVPTTESLDHSHHATNSNPATKIMSISAMNTYSNKSHEELRLEDHQQQQKNQVTSVFGNGTSSPSVLPRRRKITLKCPAPSTVFTPKAVHKATACEPLFSKKSHSDGLKEADDSSCVPKGLEIIVENLGFNPWSQGKDNANKLDSQVVGGILPCAEADKDEDIIALAEFAVEQHNALHKDDFANTFMKVVVACLEPFQGGRYHIVLDTVLPGPGSAPSKRHYAVVLRKCTPRANNVMVLEKWLSS